MPMIRTVFNPDTPREVDEHEASQLEREGLLLPLEEPEAAPEPATPATPEVVVEAAPSAAAKPSKETKEATPDGQQGQ